jgi:LemA protein
MPAIFITTITMIAVTAFWAISTQRKLEVLNDNVKNSMAQIGDQLSRRFDALTAILNMTKGYANYESQVLIEKVNLSRRSITAFSSPEDVLRQEKIICEVLGKIDMITKLCPEIKNNQNYLITMNAVQIFENMVRTSRLIYNGGVDKLNREIGMFPASTIAGILGFHQKEYFVNNQTGGRFS